MAGLEGAKAGCKTVATAASRTTMGVEASKRLGAQAAPERAVHVLDPMAAAAIRQPGPAARSREVCNGMFQGEVCDWMTPPATASLSASRRVRHNAATGPAAGGAPTRSLLMVCSLGSSVNGT